MTFRQLDLTRRRAVALSLLLLASTVLGGGARAAARDSVTVAIDPLATLDPAFARGTGSDLSILSQIYSALTNINAKGDLVGDLATKWEQTGPEEFTFTLHEGATFKNGKPLDAAAVVWNIQRMKDPATKATANTDFELIAAVKATSPTTVVFTTKGPWLDLPRRLSWTYLLEPEWAADHNPKTEANPSGPYDLISYEPASKVVLKRNEAYYGSKPEIANVIYKVVGATATRISGLRSGEIDASLRIDPIDMAQLERLSDYTVSATPGRRSHMMRMNTGTKALSDVRVRQALNYAIDKVAITKSIYRGMTEPGARQLLSQFNQGFDPAIGPWPYDPAKAKALLAEAGYGDGLKLTIAVSGEAGFIAAVQSVQAIASQLKAVGIEVEIKTLPGNAFVPFLRDKKNATDLVYVAYASQSNSSAELLGQFTGNAGQTWGPVPKAYDEAVAASKLATTEAGYISALRAAQKVYADEAMIVFLWPQPQTYAFKKDIDWPVRSDDWVRASEMSLKK